MSRSLFLMLVGVALAGCSGSGGEALWPRYSVRDSAGVQIVENGPVGALSDSVLPLMETLRLGLADGPDEYLFARPLRVFVDQGDTIFVAEHPREIRAYAPDGTFVRRYGRPGSGPGEFRSTQNLAVTADHVAVTDRTLGRVTVFSRSGEVVGLHSVHFRYGLADLIAETQEGAWVARIRVDSGNEAKWKEGIESRDTVIFALLDDVTAAENLRGTGRLPEGSVPIALLPGRRHIGFRTSSDGYRQPPFWEPEPAHDVDGAGNLYSTDGASYQIDVVAADGRLVRRIRREHRPVEVTAPMVDELRDFLVSHYARHSNPSMRENVPMIERRAALPAPPHLPPTGTLLVAGNGAFWVQRPDLTEDPISLEWNSRALETPTYWDAFDADGRFLVTVKLDPGFARFALSSDGRALVGAHLGEDGVPRIIRMELPFSR